MNKIQSIYENIISEENKLLKANSKKSLLIAYLRGFIFFAGVFAVFYFSEISYKYAILSGVSFLAFFLFLMQKSNKLNYKIKYSKTLIKINKNEISALNSDISNFKNGEEFINHSHDYTYDLDIFGKGSIFQYLNRTCTTSGKIKLAESLSEINEDKELIKQRQEAINELSTKVKWRQQFQTLGLILTSEKNDEKQTENHILNDLTVWAKEQDYFNKKNILKLLIWILPSITIVLAILSIFDILPSTYFGIMAILQLLVTGYFLKNINAEHAKLGEKVSALKKYETLVNVIDNEYYNAKYLEKYKSKLIVEDVSAKQMFAHLRRTIKSFDSRLNFIVALVSNMLFMWDLHIIFRLEKLKKKLALSFPIWFDVVSEFDSLACFANNAYNNPDFVFPEISENEFTLNTQELGHPLLEESSRVNNNFTIDSLNKIDIITGANMAGKSTFLRTVGVNLILAQTGAKVCANKYIFSPIKLYTSIRNSDSLQKNESYFYAELMRLKELIDRLKNGEKLFIILDEILRGTNSNDKHLGSKKLIEQLINFKTSGLVATHDIQLGNLKEEYTENIDNLRFEVDIEKDKLVFDYKIKEGISKNLNATFLMKKYGIIND